jgi:hypothetical protein
MSIKDRVAIIGVGATKFGENFEMTYQDMALEAVYEAYQDAGLDTKDMEAAWLGTLSPTDRPGGDAGASLSEPLNFYPDRSPGLGLLLFGDGSRPQCRLQGCLGRIQDGPGGRGGKDAGGAAREAW